MAKDAEGSVLTRRLLELTWKPGKIILQTELLIVAYFVLFCAHLIAPSSAGPAWFASVIIFLGRVIAYFIVLLGMTAVAKMTLADLKGKDPVTARAAFAAAGGKLKDVIASPIKIFALFAGLVVFHVVIDLIGKIPFIGELAWMFSPIFTFPLGIAMVGAILVLVFGAMILPTIIVLGKEGPVSELIDFLRRHTIKFAGHFMVALVVAVITLIVLVWAIGLSNAVSGQIMGEKLIYIQNRVPQWLQQTPGQTLTHIVTVLRGGSMSRMIQNPQALRWTISVSGFVYGLIMWLIHMSFWGFVVVNFSVAGTLSYLGLTGDSEGEEKAEPEEKAEEPEESASKKVEEAKAPPAKKPAPKTKPATKKEEKPAAAEKKPKE